MRSVLCLEWTALHPLLATYLRENLLKKLSQKKRLSRGRMVAKIAQLNHYLDILFKPDAIIVERYETIDNEKKEVERGPRCLSATA